MNGLHKIIGTVYLGIITIILVSCQPKNDKQVWIPEYQPYDIVHKVTNQPIQKLKAGGKVYIYQDYLFQIELNEGIHVYKLEGSSYQPITFLQIFGAQEISIRQDVLLTNNYEDLISIDISDMLNIKVVDRKSQVFKINTNAPPENGYFECIDETKGRVTGWQLKDHSDNLCYF